ncbi:hypothetical protein QE152_g30564 [Popillia japonica]|uniref:Uncharacterized protein n=1 Tax=Popillia japonica TaxID=7064 RepID=A0AAW1JDK4_POPJA
MKLITRRLNGLLMREKINRPVIEEVLSLASDYERVIYKAMLENELLKGRLLELERERESMRMENLRREEVWKQERERDAIRINELATMKSDKNESSEVVKERVLKEVSPWVNVRVRGVRKLKSGGVAIETASERELDSLRASAKFRQCGMNVELPRAIGPRALIFDVPSQMTEAGIIEELYRKNVEGLFEEKEFKERMRIVSRRENAKDKSVGNVVLEGS